MYRKTMYITILVKFDSLNKAFLCTDFHTLRFLQFFRRGIPDSWLCRRYSCSRCWRFPRSPGRCVSWLWVTSRHFKAGKVKQMFLFLKNGPLNVKQMLLFFLKNSNKCKHYQDSILSQKGHNSCHSSKLRKSVMSSTCYLLICKVL